MISKIKLALKWIKSLSAAVEAFLKTWEDGKEEKLPE
jgi:hypothetical protein